MWLRVFPYSVIERTPYKVLIMKDTNITGMLTQRQKGIKAHLHLDEPNRSDSKASRDIYSCALIIVRIAIFWTFWSIRIGSIRHEKVKIFLLFRDEFGANDETAN